MLIKLAVAAILSIFVYNVALWYGSVVMVGNSAVPVASFVVALTASIAGWHLGSVINSKISKANKG